MLFSLHNFFSFKTNLVSFPNNDKFISIGYIPSLNDNGKVDILEAIPKIVEQKDLFSIYLLGGAKGIVEALKTDLEKEFMVMKMISLTERWYLVQMHTRGHHKKFLLLRLESFRRPQNALSFDLSSAHYGIWD